MKLLFPSQSIFGAAASAAVLLAVAVLAPVLNAQQQPAPQDGKVELRIRLVLPDARPGTQRETTVFIQPVDPKGPGANTAPGTAKVTEGATTVVMLPPGPYQITSMDPVMTNSQASGWDIEMPVTSSPTDLELSQQNAVRVTPFGKVDASTATASTSEHKQTADAATRQQIETVLDRWIESLKAHDLDAQMTCYAPHLRRYFLKQDVSAAQVRRDKERFLQRYPDIRNLELHDIQIASVDGHPDVTAVKAWSFGGQRDWTGQVVTHLGFARENGRWVIVSERERLINESVPFGEGTAALSKAPR